MAGFLRGENLRVPPPCSIHCVSSSSICNNVHARTFECTYAAYRRKRLPSFLTTDRAVISSNPRENALVIVAAKKRHDGKRRKKKKLSDEASLKSEGSESGRGEEKNVNPPPRITQHINVPVRQQIRAHRMAKAAQSSKATQKIVPQRFIKRSRTTEEYKEERALAEARTAALSKQESKNFALRQLYGTNVSDRETGHSLTVSRLRASPLPPLLLVDGYNVLFKWKADVAGQTRDTNGQENDEALSSFAEARDALIESLGEYSQIRGIRIVIAFDAMGSGNGSFREETLRSGITVAWCGDREADTYIEAQARIWLERKHPMVVVATSDVLQRTVVDANAIKAIEQSRGRQVCQVIPSSGLIKDMEASLVEAQARISDYNVQQGPGMSLLGSAVKAQDSKTFDVLQSMRLGNTG